MTTVEAVPLRRAVATINGIIAEHHHVPGPGVEELVRLAAAVQEARHLRLKDIDAVTRTTALWTAMYLDDAVAKAGRMFGVTPAEVERTPALPDVPAPLPVDDVVVHEWLARALHAHLDSRLVATPRTVGLADVAIAVLRDAEAHGGPVADRLAEARVDVAGLVAALESVSAAERAAAPRRAALSESAALYLGFHEALREGRGPDAEDHWTWPAFGLVAARRRGTMATVVVRAVLECRGERTPVLGAAAALRAFALPGGVEPVGVPSLDDPAVARLLAAAAAARDAVEPQGAIRIRHLVAAALVAGPGPRGAPTRDEDLAVVRARFLAQIEHDAPADVAARWRAHVTDPPPPVEVPAPAPAGRAVSGLRVDLVDATTDLADALGVAGEVATLCDVITARDAPPPISVGLFGRWGSGKSYFMALMRRRVDEIRETARAAAARGEETAYCTETVQVTFNAWHYMDADDLWATMAVHLFGAIAQVDPDDERARPRADVVRDLEHRERRMETADRRIARVLGDPRLDRAAELMGLEADRADVLGVVHEAGRAAGLLSTARALLTTGTWTRRRRWTIALTAVAVLALVAVTGLLVAGVLPVATLVGLLPAAVAVLETTRRWLRGVRDGLAHANALVAASGLNPRDISAERIANDREVMALRAELEAIDRHAGMGDFVRERALSTDYTSHFGVLSVLRGDLEKLVAKQERESRNRRIVLYIDDLDRCSPARVVEVLQAVHLLLAFPLFVAVVGVDPRWLLTSLQRHYRQVLATAPGSPGTSGAVSTPHDYLEKIFQIPFSIPPMGPEGFTRLVGDLAGPVAPAPDDPAPDDPAPDDPAPDAAVPLPRPADGAAVPATPAPAPDAPGGAGRPSPEPAPPAAGAETLSWTVVSPNPPRLQLTAPEVAAMARMRPLIGTPRAANRLVNLYRLIRAGLPEDEVERFVADGRFRPLVVVLAAQVGFPRVSAGLLDRLVTGDGASLSTALERIAPGDPDEVALCRTLRAVCVDGEGRLVPDWDRPVAELAAWLPRLRRFSLDAALGP